MDGGKKFRSSVLVVKTALKFLIKSEIKHIEIFYQKRKLIIINKQFYQALLI